MMYLNSFSFAEGEAAVSVEDVLMFATGLSSLPPIWLGTTATAFPMANTCSNSLRLPLLYSYTLFKSQMDFGIKSSPGFGCF